MSPVPPEGPKREFSRGTSQKPTTGENGEVFRPEGASIPLVEDVIRRGLAARAMLSHGQAAVGVEACAPTGRFFRAQAFAGAANRPDALNRGMIHVIGLTLD